MISKEDVKNNFNIVVSFGFFNSDISNMGLYFALRRMFKKYTNIESIYNNSPLVYIDYIYENKQLKYFKDNFECCTYGTLIKIIRIRINICDMPYKDISNNKYLLFLRSKHQFYKTDFKKYL